MELRDPEGADPDDAPWGRINDREVAKALREGWARIPPSYRRIVARYFRDITELDPEPPAGERSGNPPAPRGNDGNGGR